VKRNLSDQLMNQPFPTLLENDRVIWDNQSGLAEPAR